MMNLFGAYFNFISLEANIRDVGHNRLIPFNPSRNWSLSVKLLIYYNKSILSNTHL